MSREAGLDWMRDLSRRHDTVTAVTAFSGGVWLRLSASVYNCRQDFLSLRHCHQAGELGSRRVGPMPGITWIIRFLF